MVAFARKALYAAPAFALLLIASTDNGKKYLRRLAANCVHNVYASETEIVKIPPIPPSTTKNIPAYIALCQEWLRWDAYYQGGKLRTEKFLFVEDDRVCMDWSSPHLSYLDIAAALVIDKFMPGDKYRHNCDRTRVYDEAVLGFDHSTIQQIFNTPGLGVDDTIMSEQALKQQCRRCLLYYDPRIEIVRVKSRAHHHCFAWPEDLNRNTDVRHIPVQPTGSQVTALSTVIKPTIQRFNHAAMEWRSVTDKPPKEEETGAIIYFDQYTLGINYAKYLDFIPAGTTSITVLSGPLCASAFLKTGQLCHDYGKGLANYLSGHFPNLARNGFAGGPGAVFQISASTAAINSRLVLAHLTICAPHTTSCYFPALSKVAFGSSIVLEDPTWKKAIDFFTITGSQGKVKVLELSPEDIPQTYERKLDEEKRNLVIIAPEFSHVNALINDEGYPLEHSVPPMPDDATINKLTAKQILDDFQIAVGRYEQNPNIFAFKLSIVPTMEQIQEALRRKKPLTVNVVLGNGKSKELSIDRELNYIASKYSVEYLKTQNLFRYDSMLRIQHAYAESQYGTAMSSEDGNDPSTIFEIKCPTDKSVYTGGRVVTDNTNYNVQSDASGADIVNKNTKVTTTTNNTDLVPPGIPFRKGDGWMLSGIYEQSRSLSSSSDRRMVAVDARSFKFGEDLHRICAEAIGAAA